MKLTDKKMIQMLCDQYGIKPTRLSGQNFFADELLLADIVSHANVRSDECVLEVGPGLGALSVELAPRCGKLLAVERDSRLTQALARMFAADERVKVAGDDILKFPMETLARDFFDNQPYRVISNLPYSITSHFLRTFLTREYHPSGMVLLLQKEVAERICAQKGEMSLLSLSVQVYAKPKIVMPKISRDAFWPAPEIESALIAIEEIESHEVAEARLGVSLKNLFQTARIGFSSKRKTLANNLSGGFRREKKFMQDLVELAGLDAQIRAQDLSVTDWVQVTKAIFEEDESNIKTR